MQEFSFYQAATEQELQEKLSSGHYRLIAGGTDVIPRMKKGFLSSEALLDIHKIQALRFIRDDAGEVAVGALTTHQDLMESDLIQESNPALAAAAESVGCIQTRCRGTLGGNLANASPAGDTIPALMIMDAEVILRSQQGERRIALKDFFQGPGKTNLTGREYIHRVVYSKGRGGYGTSFQKLGKRSGMAIAVVNAAAYLQLDHQDTIEKARIALGSVAPIVVLCREAQQLLVGQKPGDAIFQKAAEACRNSIAAIDDVRSTQIYRMHAAVVLAERAVREAARRAGRRLS